MPESPAPKSPQRGTISSATKAGVLARDGWKCGLCGVAVASNRAAPHPLSLSYDHILEVREGGDEAIWNLRVTHLRCNIVRSTPKSPRIALDLPSLVAERSGSAAGGDIFAQAIHGPSLPQPPPTARADEIGPLYDRVIANTARHIDQRIRENRQDLTAAGAAGEDELRAHIDDLRDETASSYRQVFERMLPDVLALAPFYEATPAPRGLTASLTISEPHPALYTLDLIEELLTDAGIDDALDQAEHAVALAPETGRNWEKVFNDFDRLPELKRRDDLGPALQLALSLVADVEALTPSEYPREIPPPAFTEQAAIIYRKMKNYDGEVAILERYAQVCRDRGMLPPRGAAEDLLKKRLPKARALRDKARKRGQ